jgi:MraZ protein
VVTQGQENCLVVWPADVFMEEARRAQATPLTNRGARDYARVLFAGAEEATPDKQGRVALPPHLRQFARLEREVVVNGAFDHVEIWDASTWREKKRRGEEALSGDETAEDRGVATPSGTA